MPCTLSLLAYSPLAKPFPTTVFLTREAVCRRSWAAPAGDWETGLYFRPRSPLGPTASPSFKGHAHLDFPGKISRKGELIYPLSGLTMASKISEIRLSTDCGSCRFLRDVKVSLVQGLANLCRKGAESKSSRLSGPYFAAVMAGVIRLCTESQTENAFAMNCEMSGTWFSGPC